VAGKRPLEVQETVLVGKKTKSKKSEDEMT
jgi:hypothetical protein